MISKSDLERLYKWSQKTIFPFKKENITSKYMGYEILICYLKYGKKKTFLRSIKKLYINLREQRIEAIEVDNIIENLQKDGGFSYKSALVLSVIDNQTFHSMQ